MFCSSSEVHSYFHYQYFKMKMIFFRLKRCVRLCFSGCWRLSLVRGAFICSKNASAHPLVRDCVESESLEPFSCVHMCASWKFFLCAHVWEMSEYPSKKSLEGLLPCTGLFKINKLCCIKIILPWWWRRWLKGDFKYVGIDKIRKLTLIHFFVCVNHVNHVSHINQTKSYLLHLRQFFLHIFIIVQHPIILNISALATGWPGLCWNLTWQSLDAAFRSDWTFPRCQNFSFRTLAITLVAFLSQEQMREKTQSLFMWSQVCLTFLCLQMLFFDDRPSN